MVLTALRGALGFLSRLPVGADEDAWAAFRQTPLVFPLAGYVLGALAAVPLLVGGSLPAPVVAVAFLAVVVGLSGINHADGVADLGDAAVVHEERREVLKDTRVGVGAVLALALVVAGLALAGLALAALPVWIGVGLVVAGEVGAKLGMAALACLGTAAHEGLGSQFTARATRGTLVGPVLVALPAALLTPWSLAALAALLGGPVAAVGLMRWANRHLGGVSGDVFGATNELGRVLGLHLGVVAWTLS